MNWIDENSTALIAAGSALLSALVAGGFALFGVWLNNSQNNVRLENQLQHEISKENRMLFIDKGEELYVAVNKWYEHVRAHYLAEEAFAKGEMNRDQMRAVLIGYPISVAFTRVETLTALYFSELKTILSAARNARSQAYAILDQLAEEKLKKDNAIAMLSRSNLLYDKEVDKFQVALQSKLMEYMKNG